MNLVVVYLASPRSRLDLKWNRMDCLEASLKLLKRFAPPSPVIIFHEDYLPQDMERMMAANSGVTFHKVDFATHLHRYRPGYSSSHTGLFGYGMMCRFFSGVMQAHPALDGYSHYMRLDDDSYIMSPIDGGVLKRIEESDYTYRCTSSEPCPALWEHAVKFMRDNQIPIPKSAEYSTTVPYNNYHTSSLSMWRHPAIAAFTRSLDDCDAFISKGWTDAATHRAILTLLCPAAGKSVAVESGFCYRHNQHCSHRPGFQHGDLCRDGNDAHHKGNMQHQWGPPQL